MMKMSIRTSKRNHLYIVQKLVRGQWQRITDASFEKRATARACSRELNNIQPKRYRVVKLEIAAPSRS